jgi:cell division protein ZapA (FtsZ GTPase activity inhibitor)
VALVAADEIKKCSVRIGGVYYQLVTAENEQYTRRIAARADEMINRVMQDNPQLSQAMSTVLALVNAVDELSRAYQQLKGMEGQHLDLDSKASEARRELGRLREQHWEMKKELLRITELNSDYQTLINKLTQAGAKKELEIQEIEQPQEQARQLQVQTEDSQGQNEDPQGLTEEQPLNQAQDEPLGQMQEYPPDEENRLPVQEQAADYTEDQPVSAETQPDLASAMDTEEEQAPEQIAIADPPGDLPDPNQPG